MAEPGGFSPGDLLAAVVASMIAGVGAAMAWFSSSKKKILERLFSVETKMQAHSEKHAKHTTEIAVVQANQANMTERLDEIKETTKNTDKKLDSLAETLTDVLLAIRSKS